MEISRIQSSIVLVSIKFLSSRKQRVWNNSNDVVQQIVLQGPFELPNSPPPLLEWLSLINMHAYAGNSSVTACVTQTIVHLVAFDVRIIQRCLLFSSFSDDI